MDPMIMPASSPPERVVQDCDGEVGCWEEVWRGVRWGVGMGAYVWEGGVSRSRCRRRRD